ncbi:MAG TPA: cystathionine beta-lyase [Alphaproteobacteria bacterium]|jgi:cystathionine beta-lyase|nr:cystathionine beta-lyase [Alphaproteobacteria bacterium]HJO89209.1 cystathionine beta-lyase [Alphaproteobacteria bacterium]
MSGHKMKKRGKKKKGTARRDTRIATSGLDPHGNFGIINPPVYHASTVLFPTVKDLKKAVSDPFNNTYYGRFGTPTSAAFEEAVAEIEGGERAIATSSGLAAITCALTAFLESGDHLLMADTVYEPTRKFCDGILKGFGVETEYYDPLIGGGIADLMRDNTHAVFMESPGSLTFEVQDVPAIAAAARERGVVSILDNTWGTPLFFRPFEHGVDIAIEAATKYISGHADAMLGAIIMKDVHFKRLKTATVALGNSAGPDDCYLGLRGLRTLSVRLARHQETGLTLARWLNKQPEVARMLHPALPDDPGHRLWKRDFIGTSGLFGVELNPVAEGKVEAMLDGFDLFGMGFSWGGFESLALPVEPNRSRSATTWKGKGPLLRIHAGLEDPDDLLADLEAGLKKLG